MQFYVYTLAYPDGKVFYVGKGQGNRIDAHEYEARTGKGIKNPYKVNVIRKIWAGGGEVVKEKVFETDDEREALNMEVEYISYFGRSNLTNLTDGGEGTSGVRAETREYRSAYMQEYHRRKRESGMASWIEDVVRKGQHAVYPNGLIADRYSSRKLYPTPWEEPGDFREYGQDVMDLEEFITS